MKFYPYCEMYIDSAMTWKSIVNDNSSLWFHPRYLQDIAMTWKWNVNKWIIRLAEYISILQYIWMNESWSMLQDRYLSIMKAWDFICVAEYISKLRWLESQLWMRIYNEDMRFHSCCKIYVDIAASVNEWTLICVAR